MISAVHKNCTVKPVTAKRKNGNWGLIKNPGRQEDLPRSSRAGRLRAGLQGYIIHIQGGCTVQPIVEYAKLKSNGLPGVP